MSLHGLIPTDVSSNTAIARLRSRHQLNGEVGVADLAGAERRRRFAAGAGAAAGSLSESAPIVRSAASAARSPLSHAPSTVPHSVSWVASPARNMQPTGSVRIFRDGCPPGRATDIAPSVNGEAFQRVALDFLTAAATSLPNSLVSHSTANAIIAFSPWPER